jgi:hypothetical protein
MSLKHLLIGLVKTLQMPLNDGLSSLTMTRFKQQLDVHQRGAEFTMVNLARSTKPSVGVLPSVGTEKNEKE